MMDKKVNDILWKVACMQTIPKKMVYCAMSLAVVYCVLQHLCDNKENASL